MVNVLPDLSNTSFLPSSPPGDAAAAAMRTYQEKSRDIVSVKDFGAVGDGHADDTAAIQAAVTYVASRSYIGSDPQNFIPAGTVYFPQGVYKTGPITLPSVQFIRLFGAGFSSKLISNGTGPIFRWQTVASGVSIVAYAVIEHMNLDGNGGTDHLIDTSYCSSTSLRNLYLHGIPNGKDGIHVNGHGTDGVTYSHDISVEDITINTNTGRAGIFLSGLASDFRISRIWCQGNFGLQYAIYFAPGCGTGQISDSHIYNVSQNVVYAESNSGILTFSNVLTDYANQDTIYLKNCVGVFFIGGKFYLGTNSITISDSKNVKIIGSEFEGLPGTSVYAIKETGTSDNNSYIGCHIRGGYSAIQPILLSGSASIVRYVEGFSPLGYSSAQSGVTISAIAASTTTYLGTSGAQVAEFRAQCPVADDGRVKRIIIASTVAPGAGQSFTYTLRKNSTDAPMTGSISGAGIFIVEINGSVPVKKGDSIGLKLVTSSGAAASDHRYTILVEH